MRSADVRFGRVSADDGCDSAGDIRTIPAHGFLYAGIPRWCLHRWEYLSFGIVVAVGLSILDRTELQWIWITTWIMLLGATIVTSTLAGPENRRQRYFPRGADCTGYEFWAVCSNLFGDVELAREVSKESLVMSCTTGARRVRA